jgi:hypothetical protein
MAFAPISRGSALPRPTPKGGLSNDAAGFASCYGPHYRSPIRAFDAGLRPRPFPDETASLLPGLLAATRTGLSPASDDELTNNKIHRYVTASPPALLGARKRLSENQTAPAIAHLHVRVLWNEHGSRPQCRDQPRRSG